MKLRTIIVFGVGYVAGTHAGRERFDRFKAIGDGFAARVEDWVRPADAEGEDADEDEPKKAAA